MSGCARRARNAPPGLLASGAVLLFRQFVNEDLGCASYLVGDAQAGVAVSDVATTLDRLEQAYEQRSADLVWLAVRPVFATLRSEPRFHALCERMRLSPPE